MDTLVVHMQVLLTEYDGIVVNLQQEIDRFKNEHEELKQYVLLIVEDNNRLNDELRENVRTRMVAGNHSEIEKDLQLQLELASEAKEMVLEMWQLALQEIERLEHTEKKSDSFIPDTHRLPSTAFELKQEYSRALEIMSKELTTHKEDLRFARSELISVRHESERLKYLTNELEEKIAEREREANTSKTKMLHLQPRIVELEAELVNAHSSLAQLQKDLETEKNRSKLLEDSISNHELYRVELETREADAIQKAKESIQLVESALLEKDAAILTEQKAVQELKGLQDTLKEVVEMAAERAKEEITVMQQKCNKSIKQLLEEVQTLEKENSEKTALLERAVREKRAAETELAALYNEGFHKEPQETTLFRDLNFRLIQMEKDRDYAKISAGSLQDKLQSVERSFRQQDSILRMECKQLKENLKQVQKSYVTSNEERLRFFEDIQRLNQNLQDSENENTSLKRKLQQEISHLESALLQQQDVYLKQLQEAQRIHQSSISELRSLIDDQQNMSSKWKNEVRVMSDKFEKEIKDLNTKLLQTKEANGKLSTALTEFQQKASSAENQKNKYAAEVSELKRRIEELNKAGLIL